MLFKLMWQKKIKNMLIQRWFRDDWNLIFDEIREL